MKKTLLFIFFCGLSLTAVSQTTILLEKINGVYMVPCKLNGLNMKFVFDTGASDVTISLTEAIFMLKNGYLLKNDFIGTNYYQVANGDIQEGTKIIIRKLVIGGYELNNIEASIIHRLDAPLLLGQSALEKLGKFNFDYSNKVLMIFDGKKNNSNYGCISGNCSSGYGTYIFANGEKYIGYFKNGNRDGQGTLTFLGGEKYVGDFKDNEYDGYGTLTINEYVYVGYFKVGKRNGNGTAINANGSKYVGV